MAIPTPESNAAARFIHLSDQNQSGSYVPVDVARMIEIKLFEAKMALRRIQCADESRDGVSPLMIAEDALKTIFDETN